MIQTASDYGPRFGGQNYGARFRRGKITAPEYRVIQIEVAASRVGDCFHPRRHPSQAWATATGAVSTGQLANVAAVLVRDAAIEGVVLSGELQTSLGA